MKMKGITKNLKIKKLKNDNSKIYLGFSLELLRAMWGQFSFRQFLVLVYPSQGLQAPSNVVSANYRVLICCICHFQSSSLFFILVSSVCKSLQCLISALTQGGKGGHLFRLTYFSCAMGREERFNQTSLACVGSARSVWAALGLPPLTVCVCFPG